MKWRARRESGTGVLDELEGDRTDRIRLRGTSHVSHFKYNMRSHRFFVSETIQLCLAFELVPGGPGLHGHNIVPNAKFIDNRLVVCVYIDLKLLCSDPIFHIFKTGLSN